MFPNHVEEYQQLYHSKIIDDQKVNAVKLNLKGIIRTVPGNHYHGFHSHLFTTERLV